MPEQEIIVPLHKFATQENPPVPFIPGLAVNPGDLVAVPPIPSHVIEHHQTFTLPRLQLYVSDHATFQSSELALRNSKSEAIALEGLEGATLELQNVAQLQATEVLRRAAVGDTAEDYKRIKNFHERNNSDYVAIKLEPRIIGPSEELEQF